MILVNEDKRARAQMIVDLISGKIVPRTAEEVERKEHYTKMVATADMDMKKDDVLTFIYEKLGGLVRTEAEQAKAETKKKEMQSKGRKDRMGLK